jgi:uncharacterized protein (DUF1501 family)
MPTTRRSLLKTGLAGAALGVGSSFASLTFAAPGREGDGRFVFVILRGGLDGLSAVPAIGDPQFASARAALGQFAAPPLALDGPFALHPSLARLHAMYGRNELAVVHAAGLPYRERSHFDAQQVLESGGLRPYELGTGWLGRALAASGQHGLALATSVPLVLRGKGGVDTWSPSALPDPAPDLIARLQTLYAGDAALSQALARARRLRDDGDLPGAEPAMAPGAPRPAMAVTLARKAGEFIAQPNGPRAAVLEMGGWDTHANQSRALENNLRVLDEALGALRDALVAPASQGAWGRTVVVVATEFGREVSINGTAGTDHGTGTAAFVLGGAVRGGRVVADWPGLAKASLNEGRDLRITTDLRAVLAGVLGEHLRVPGAVLESEVFPGTSGLRPVVLV